MSKTGEMHAGSAVPEVSKGTLIRGYQSGNKHRSEVVNGVNTSPLVPLRGGGEKLVCRKSTELFNTLAACSVNLSDPLGILAVV